jgi:VanZ family protein
MGFLRYYNNKRLWLIGFIACTAGIILVSIIPYTTDNNQQATSGFRWDYIEHFFAFFAFGSLFILWRSDRNFGIRGLELVLLITVAVCFSLGTEYVQLFIPGRAFNLVDIIYNLAGVLVSVLFVYMCLIRYYIRRKYKAY